MGCFFRPTSNTLWSLWYGFFMSGLFVYLLFIDFQRYEVLSNAHVESAEQYHARVPSYDSQQARTMQSNDDLSGVRSEFSEPQTHYSSYLDRGGNGRSSRKHRQVNSDGLDISGTDMRKKPPDQSLEPYRRASDKPDRSYPSTVLSMYIILHIFAVVLLLLFICSTCVKVGNLANDNERLGDYFEDPVIETQGSPCCSSMRSLWRHSPPTSITLHLMITMLILLANMFITTEYFKITLGNPNDPTAFAKRDQLEAWNMGPLDFLFANRVKVVMDKKGQSYFPQAVISAMHVPPPLVPILADYHLFGMPLDFLLHLFGLILFMVAYPSVFWRAGPCFSMTFSIMLFVHAVDAVCGYLGFALMYRLHIYGVITEATQDQKTLHQILSPPLLVANFMLTSAISYLSSSVLHCYGYGRYVQALQSQRRDARIGARCDGYLPNACAILVLVLLVLCRAPLFYDMLMLSQIQTKTAEQVKLLLCIAASVLFLFTWLIIWLILTLNRNWGFRVPPLAFHLYRKSDPGSLIVLYGQETFLVDDHHKRAGILTLLDKNRANDPDVYWLKPQTRAVGRTPPPNHLPPSVPHTPLDEKRELTYRTGSRQGSLTRAPHENSAPPGWDAEVDRDQISPSRSLNRRPLAPRGSGSYIRFNDEAYEPLNDAVTTFGTMPRGTTTDQRALEMQRRCRQYEANQARAAAAGATMGPNYSNVTYALVQKRNNAIAAAGGGQGPASGYYKLPQNSDYPSETVALLEDQHMSRASSYSNVPSTHGRGVPIQQIYSQGPGAAHWADGTDSSQVSGRGQNTGRDSVDRYASYASIQQQNAQLRQRGGSHSPDTLVIPRSPVGNRHPPGQNPQGRPPMIPGHTRMTSFSTEPTYQSHEATPGGYQQVQGDYAPSNAHAYGIYGGTTVAGVGTVGLPVQSYGQYPIVVHKQNHSNVMEDSGIVASNSSQQPTPSNNGSESSGSGGRAKQDQGTATAQQSQEHFVTSVV